MNTEELKNYVINNSDLISIKNSEKYPDLSVLKYKNKCFYENIWNRYTETCRGKVVDKKFNVVVNPFEKIYNYGIEKNAPILSDAEPIIAVRKFNGFMAAVSKYNGEVIVSTTGSLDSSYAQLARDMILSRTKENEYFEDVTTLYEIVHHSDPHIIPEKEGIYFIGQRDNQLNSKVWYWHALHNQWDLNKDIFENSKITDDFYESKNVYVPYLNFTTLGKLKEHVKTVKHEGFVFYTRDAKSAKIKSPYYLMAKFLARCNNTDKILKYDAKENFPEEFYGIIDKVKEEIGIFNALNAQDRLVYIRKYFDRL